MSLITSSEVRQPGKAPNYSVNWTIGSYQIYVYIYYFFSKCIRLFHKLFLIHTLGQSEAEVINCTTGKDELGKPSRISKQAFFRRFFNLLSKLPTIDDVDENRCRHYLDAKSSVQDYSVSITFFICII